MDAKGEGDSLAKEEADAPANGEANTPVKGEADAPISKSSVTIEDESDAMRLVWLEGGESSRRSMSPSPRATAVSRKVSSSR